MISDAGTTPRAADRRSPLETAGAFFASLDKLQLGMTVFLCVVGLVFIRSTGIQLDRGPRAFWFQLLWMAAGGAAYIGCSLVDPRSRRVRTAVLLAYPLAVLLLLLVLHPRIGIKAGGAYRWLGVGALRIQPSEFAKLGLILALSALLTTTIFNVNRLKGIAAAAVLTLLTFELIRREPDLGSATVCLPVALAIIFCAGMKRRYIICGAVAAALLGGAVALNETVGSKPFLTKYQRARINTFLHPDADRTGSGYNAYQAKLAVGSGGLTGKGIGSGTQTPLGYMPSSVSNNDFIFSVIAEETGFFGALVLICGYMLLVYAILRTAFVVEDDFGRSLCVGVATLFFTHMFINIGMNIGVMPVTGLPLPLVSYGGSFTVVALAALGMVQAVHRHR